MKKNLLSLAMLACAATGTASAEEFYLIKDGKLQSGVEVVDYVKAEEQPTFESGVEAPDGSAASLLKLNVKYKDARFYIPEGVDLSKYWNVEIEFYFKDGDIDVTKHCGTNKWAVINMGFAADTVGGISTIDQGFCQNAFDVKLKNKPDTWNVEKQFIYAPPAEKAFKYFVLGWQRQILAQDSIGPTYIKNLKFYGKGTRPFFAEDFNTQAAYSDVLDGAQTYVVQGTFMDNEIEEEDPIRTNNINILLNQHCNLPIYSGCAEGATKRQTGVLFRRLFEDTGSDGSNIYDCEHLHSINLVSSSVRTGRKGRTFFLVPTAGVEKAEGFTLDYIIKWDASKFATETVNQKTSKDSLDMRVFYAFVDDAIEANTCEMTPAFKEGALLSDRWTAHHVEFANNLNGKKYIAIIFDEPKTFSYCVDDIQLAATNLSLVGATVEAHPVGVVAYETVAKTGVNNINAEIAAEVSPVPATDIVTVSNEGVTKVEVLNAAGAVVASANGNQVNVANLTNGIYVIKAYAAEGILIAKIIKN